MEGTLSFKDVIKKSVLTSGAFFQTVTLDVLLHAALTVLLALIVGFLIYGIYRKSFRGVVFSQSFAISLIGMTVLTCGIIVTIQSNVVLSLGMVGALSIVRYRTAVKDPTDLMFLFWTVAAGIATGAGMFFIALIVSAIMGLLLLLTSRTHSRDALYVVLIHYTGQDIGDEIRKIMGTRRYEIKSKTMRKQDVELAMEVRVSKHNMAFAEQLQALDGVADVTLVQYQGDYIG